MLWFLLFISHNSLAILRARYPPILLRFIFCSTQEPLEYANAGGSRGFCMGRFFCANCLEG